MGGVGGFPGDQDIISIDIRGNDIHGGSRGTGHCGCGICETNNVINQHLFLLKQFMHSLLHSEIKPLYKPLTNRYALCSVVPSLVQMRRVYRPSSSLFRCVNVSLATPPPIDNSVHLDDVNKVSTHTKTLNELCFKTNQLSILIENTERNCSNLTVSVPHGLWWQVWQIRHHRHGAL